MAKSLENLGLDYVDLLLVHWPVPLNPASGENIPLRPDGSRDIDEEWSPEKTWALMEKIPETGKAKAVGVSNWSEYNTKKKKGRGFERWARVRTSKSKV